MTSTSPASGPSADSWRPQRPTAAHFDDLLHEVAQALVDPVVQLEWHRPLSTSGRDVSSVLRGLVALAQRAVRALETGRDSGDVRYERPVQPPSRPRSVDSPARRRRPPPRTLDDPEALSAELAEVRLQLGRALQRTITTSQVLTPDGASVRLERWLADRLVEVVLELDELDRAVGVRTPVSESTLRLAIDHAVAAACERHGPRAVLRALLAD